MQKTFLFLMIVDLSFPNEITRSSNSSLSKLEFGFLMKLFFHSSLFLMKLFIMKCSCMVEVSSPHESSLISVPNHSWGGEALTPPPPPPPTPLQLLSFYIPPSAFPTPTLSLLQLSQTSYSTPIFLSFFSHHESHLSTFIFLLLSILQLSSNLPHSPLSVSFAPMLFFFHYFPLSSTIKSTHKNAMEGRRCALPPNPPPAFFIIYPTLYLSISYSVSITAFSNFLLCSYLFFILFSSYACVPSLHLSIFLLLSILQLSSSNLPHSPISFAPTLFLFHFFPISSTFFYNTIYPQKRHGGRRRALPPNPPPAFFIIYPALYLSNSYSVSITAFSNFLVCSYLFSFFSHHMHVSHLSTFPSSCCSLYYSFLLLTSRILLYHSPLRFSCSISFQSLLQ